MNHNTGEILSSYSICAVGKRKSVNPLDGEEIDQWEVYARLTNRSIVVLANQGTETEAQLCVEKFLNEFTTNGAMFCATLEDAHVNIFTIIRLYLDRQGDSHIGLVEDEGGTSYAICFGDKRFCESFISGLSMHIAISSEGE